MSRHPSNLNLILHSDSSYFGLPIQTSKGPFFREYLSRLLQTITNATDQYREVFGFRFDLHFPATRNSQDFSFQNEVIERFIESFKAKIRHNRQMALRENRYAHDTVVRYVWARETGQLGKPHYHLAILLNKDAFCALGTFEPGRQNMFNRLHEAWASALGVPIEAVKGLVEIPQNPCYFIRRDDQSSIDAFFYRTSYLCKSATKVFGDGAHGFGASRT